MANVTIGSNGMDGGANIRSTSVTIADDDFGILYNASGSAIRDVTLYAGTVQAVLGGWSGATVTFSFLGDQAGYANFNTALTGSLTGTTVTAGVFATSTAGTFVDIGGATVTLDGLEADGDLTIAIPFNFGTGSANDVVYITNQVSHVFGVPAKGAVEFQNVLGLTQDFWIEDLITTHGTAAVDGARSGSVITTGSTGVGAAVDADANKRLFLTGE